MDGTPEYSMLARQKDLSKIYILRGIFYLSVKRHKVRVVSVMYQQVKVFSPECIETLEFFFSSDTFKVPSPGLYSPEKVHPQGERHAPQYSISARTKMRRIDQNPAPNKYTLPPIIGNKQPNKMAAPVYVMTSRREVGALYLYQFCWFKVRFVSS